MTLSIPNFSCLGSLKVAPIYLSGVGGWLYSDYNASLSSNWTKLELPTGNISDSLDKIVKKDKYLVLNSLLGMNGLLMILICQIN